MRRIAITLVVCSVVLVAASVGLAMSQRDDARAAQDGALAHEAAQERAAIEAYFDRARAIILLTSRNPAFARFYAEPGARAAKIRDDVPPTELDAVLDTGYPGPADGGRPSAHHVRA